MSYTNSPLVTYTNLTKNRNSPRKNEIDRITIHCYVGQVTAKQGCDYFTSEEAIKRKVSSNYVVGKDGSVGLSVEEKDRSWCSSNAGNDHRAITIETACDKTSPYAVTDKAYSKLIELCADICKRNGKNKLLWFNDKGKTLNYVPSANEMVLTVHRWFYSTSCPGNYLFERLSDIAAKVNAMLNGEAEKTTEKPVEIDEGDLVSISKDAVYYNGWFIPPWVKQHNWYVDSCKGDRAVLGKNQTGHNNINSPVNTKFLTVVKKAEGKVSNTTVTTKPPATQKDDFLPERGYFQKGDVSPNVGKIATFMRKNFPAYTSEKALGNTYGVNLIKAVTEFQKRTGLEPDGYFGKLTLAKLEEYGFKR